MYVDTLLVVIVFSSPKGQRIDTFSTVMFISFQTDRSEQTVKTQIRLLLIRVYTVCYSVHIFWANSSVVKRFCSNFRIIAAIFGVSEFLGFLW